MVVDHFNLMGVAVSPHEADPILIVDPYAVLPPPISIQRLEMVPRKSTEVIETMRCVHLNQLALHDPGDGPEPAGGIAEEKSLRVPTPKGSDHLLRVLRIT